MDKYPFEDHEGERWLGVVAAYDGHDWNGHVLHDVEAFKPWVITWTDGINVWDERWDDVSVALTRFAALVRAAESNTFLVHQYEENYGAFEREAERFIARTVHSIGCPPVCDGTGPTHRST